MPTNLLISPDDMRKRFDIDSDIEPDRLRPHIGTASRRLRKWVGDTAYANALSEDEQYQEMQEDLKNAEAHLAFHFAIFGLNSPLSPKGVVATATVPEGKEIRRYLEPKATAELAQHFLDLAMEIASPYTLSDGTPTAPFETIGNTDCVLDTSCEAVTRSCG